MFLISVCGLIGLDWIESNWDFLKFVSFKISGLDFTFMDFFEFGDV